MKALVSIDGGGMRGCIPARILAALEHLAGKPCCELFDFCAGTSTGGILALGLTRPANALGSSVAGLGSAPAYSAAQLVDLYRKEGQRIFSRSLGDAFVTVGGMVGPKYESTGIEAVLGEYFGTTALHEALVPTLVTGVDTLKPGPVCFRSWAPDSSRYLMRDIARATSAAPTYFPPLQAGPSTYIDGGMARNNPALRAVLDARKLWPGEELLLVSLGTGNTEKRINPIDYGLAEWLPYVVTCVMDCNSDAVDEDVADLLEGRGYYRFQCGLGGVTDAMDDASSGTVEALLGVADKLALDSAAQLAELAEVLVARA